MPTRDHKQRPPPVDEQGHHGTDKRRSRQRPQSTVAEDSGQPGGMMRLEHHLEPFKSTEPHEQQERQREPQQPKRRPRNYARSTTARGGHQPHQADTKRNEDQRARDNRGRRDVAIALRTQLRLRVGAKGQQITKLMHRKHGGGEHHHPPPASRRTAQCPRRATRWASTDQVHSPSVPKFSCARRRCGSSRGVRGYEASWIHPDATGCGALEQLTEFTNAVIAAAQPRD